MQYTRENIRSGYQKAKSNHTAAIMLNQSTLKFKSSWEATREIPKPGASLEISFGYQWLGKFNGHKTKLGDNMNYSVK